MSPLLEHLPHAEFTEHHDRVVDAPPERVWAALHETQWTDLWMTAPLMVIRGVGRASRVAAGGLTSSGPAPVFYEEPLAWAVGGFIGRPWQLAPDPGPVVSSLDQLATFDEPGWLVCGMDFTLHPLSGHRTRLATSTVCAPTDDHARRAFARYWRLIRPFSGLIRLDMLRAVARRAEQHAPVEPVRS